MIRKFKRIKRLSFSRLQLSEQNIRTFFEQFQGFFDCLQELDLQGVNLSKVDPQLLSQACLSLQKLDLTFTKLTAAQCQHLFRMLKQNKLKQASFKAANLSQVTPQT